MNAEDIRHSCLAKKGVTEGMPFGEGTLVFKVMDKLFALMGLDGDLSINLKCDPERAQELRAEYPAVGPGYHMNKRHWNTIRIDGSVDSALIYSWVDHSYDLVVQGLKKVDREALQAG